QKLVTADELLQMPEDGFKYELRQGELIKMSPPGFDHGRIGGRLYLPLAQHVEDKNLGEVLFEVGYRLESDPDTVLGPDISFVARDRSDPTTSVPGFWRGAPAL